MAAGPCCCTAWAAGAAHAAMSITAQPSSSVCWRVWGVVLLVGLVGGLGGLLGCLLLCLVTPVHSN